MEKRICIKENDKPHEVLRVRRTTATELVGNGTYHYVSKNAFRHYNNTKAKEVRRFNLESK